jgi:hypothetical protein
MENWNSMIEKITMNSTLLPVAVPYYLQERKVKQNQSAMGNPWILLGSDKGLAIESKQDHRMARPQPSFKNEKVLFEEKNYTVKIKRSKGIDR